MTLSFQKRVLDEVSGCLVKNLVSAHLVTVTPPEVLGADVLIWVLDLLFERSGMLCMLLMGVPSQLSVDGSKYQAWGRDAGDMSVNNPLSSITTELWRDMIKTLDIGRIRRFYVFYTSSILTEYDISKGRPCEG